MNPTYILTKDWIDRLTGAAMGWADHPADITQVVNTLAHRFAWFKGTDYTKTELI